MLQKLIIISANSRKTMQSTRAESFTLRRCIKPYLLKKALFRESVLGILGGNLIFVSGSHFNLATLESWGIFSFSMAMMLITLGLLPYRLLTFLELHPHKVILYRSTLLFFHLIDGMETWPFMARRESRSFVIVSFAFRESVISW
jgi:hypothetical protein